MLSLQTWRISLETKDDGEGCDDGDGRKPRASVSASAQPYTTVVVGGEGGFPGDLGASEMGWDMPASRATGMTTAWQGEGIADGDSDCGCLGFRSWEEREKVLCL